jgi:hypothetical protein
MVEVGNQMAREAQVEVVADISGQTTTQQIEVAPGGAIEARFPVACGSGHAKVRLEASLREGAKVAQEALVGLARSRRAPAPIPLTGRAKGWERADWYSLDDFPGGFFPESLRQAVANKPGDLSARFASAWDDTALYLVVDVTDDTHAQKQKPGQGWNQDNVQVLIEAPKDGPNPVRLELDLELPSGDGEKPRLFARLTPGEREAPRETTEGVRYGVARSGRHTTYELAIPWARLGMDAKPPVGQALGLAVVVNDDDEDGRGRHGLQWFFGIHHHRGNYGRLGSLWLSP